LYQRYENDKIKVVETEEMALEPDGVGRIFVHKQIVNPSESNMGHILKWSHNEH
jgi:hypothetical protein